MIDSKMVANTTGAVPVSDALVSLSMFAWSALAKRSAGAPWVICWTRADEPSKLNATLAFGFFWVKASPAALNASVSEAAANTVIEPETAGIVVVVAVALFAAGAAVAFVAGAAARAGAAAALDEPWLSPPQPA